MHSTIDRRPHIVSLADIGRPAVQESANIAGGLVTLAKLVSHQQLPGSPEEEKEALRSILGVYDRVPLDQESQECLLDLQRRIMLIESTGVDGFVDWIRTQSFSLGDWFRTSSDRRERCLLLFVLLSSTVATVFRYDLLRLLAETGIHGNDEHLDRRLAWLPRFPLRVEGTQLTESYLDATRRIEYESRARAVTSMDYLAENEFLSWPWPRQLLFLETRFERWKREAAASTSATESRATAPGVLGHSIEYRLARRGALRLLRWRGGRVATRALRHLGYGDARLETEYRPPVRLVRLLWLMLLAALSMWILGLSVRAWNQENIESALRSLQLVESPQSLPNEGANQ